MRKCGDRSGADSALRRRLERALYGSEDDYVALSSACALPLHELIPDRRR